MNASQIWMLQKLFQNNFAGNLAFDTDGDGSFDSLRKVRMLEEAVLGKCDANDGINDGVIDDPLSCDFNPEVDLADIMCTGDVNADDCFTTTQVQTIQAIYDGTRDSKGVLILQGEILGFGIYLAGSRHSPYRQLIVPCANGHCG